jgi:Ca-activated chloride channel family protein
MKHLKSVIAGLAALALPQSHGAPSSPLTEGSLYSIDREGRPQQFCPLKHTDVQANISGFLARVTVTQEFSNPSKNAIEAVYKFPLPAMAAVDAMDLWIGARHVKGDIKRREEARKIYEDARNRGQMAALLDQERPNVFTQSVANIQPGQNVKIVISYVETLKYEEGSYEFSFPMVVGPRYIPGGLHNPQDVLVNRTPKGTRAGHDIHIKVAIDAGVPLGALQSPTHEIDLVKGDARNALASLKNLNEIPNKDFVLRYQTAGNRVEEAMLTHRDARGGFFSLILQPPARAKSEEITPKEIVFVVDTSGSMHGYPMDKIKEVIKLAFDGLHPRDTFNLITFSGDEHILFPKPVPATAENIRTAWEFMKTRDGRGGTEMMKAIRAALDPTDSQQHMRVVCFMTDGEVGNDMEILGEIQRHPNARVFSFGIGNSTNRFLLDGMARYGRGEVQYVTLKEDGSIAAKRFHERVRTPLLTDVEVDWAGAPVSEVFPKRIPDVFAARPIQITGRYDREFRGKIRIKGRVAGKPWSREVDLRLPAKEAKHDVLASLWARTKIEQLMSEDFRGVQSGSMNPEKKEAITQLGLQFRLMTQFTSFVAVEEKVVNESGKPPVRVEVPVEMPEGVSYDRVEMSRARYAMAPGAVGAVRSVRAQESVMAPPPMVESPKAVDTDRKVDPALLTLAAGQTARVKIWLTSVSPDVLAKLKKAGVVIESQSGLMLTASLPAGKLREIAAFAEVKLVQAR